MISPLFLFCFRPAFEDEDSPVVLLFADCTSPTGGTLSRLSSYHYFPHHLHCPDLHYHHYGHWYLTDRVLHLIQLLVDHSQYVWLIHQGYPELLVGVLQISCQETRLVYQRISICFSFGLSPCNFFILLTKLFNFCTTLFSCFLYSVYYQVFY